MDKKIKSKMKKLPDAPGVYFFKKRENILYIGKATSLRDRVKSYFNPNIDRTRGPLVSKMVRESDSIKFMKTNSVLEALILETSLIKKYQPQYNTAEKDDKSFNHIVITNEDFPRILVVRAHDLGKKFPIKYLFGPFTNSNQLKEATKIVRKIFSYRDKCEPNQKHPCFNCQIGLCPGVCTGEISKKDYAKIIRNIRLFFSGNKKQILKNLQREMKKFAQKREFEKAHKIKKQVFALQHIQDIALIKDEDKKMAQNKNIFRIEAYDVAHLSGTSIVGAMAVTENGEIKKSDYRKFKIKDSAIDDTKALAEILTRRFKHNEWPMPDLVVVDGGLAQKNIAEKIIRQNDLKTPVVSVVKNEKHKPKRILGIMRYGSQAKSYEKEILIANAEAHRFAIKFHRETREKILRQKF